MEILIEELKEGTKKEGIVDLTLNEDLQKRYVFLRKHPSIDLIKLREQMKKYKIHMISFYDGSNIIRFLCDGKKIYVKGVGVKRYMEKNPEDWDRICEHITKGKNIMYY